PTPRCSSMPSPAIARATSSTTARASAVDRRPPAKSAITTVPSSRRSSVTRFIRKTTSVGSSTRPPAAASNGGRLFRNGSGSYPRTARLAELLAGVAPSGNVRVRPRMPRDAMRSRFGVRATSSGVLPPSDAIGSSAIPSPTTITHFIPRSLLVELENGGEPGGIGGDGEGRLRGGGRVGGVLEPVARQREHEDVAGPELPTRAHADGAGQADGGRGLGEHPFGAREQPVGGEDVVVLDRLDGAARLVARGDRTLPARRVADADRGG